MSFPGPLPGGRPLRLAKALLVPFMLVVSAPLWAEKATLLLHPTLVLLDQDTRSATVNIVNRGDATGTFALEWVDYTMTPDGLKPWDGQAPWSLQPHIRYSPRRVTLGPRETQLVKIALRRAGDVPEGEYYSHLKVLTLNDDVDDTTDSVVAGEASLPDNVIVKPRTAIAIPVIWRNSKAVPEAAIESVKIDGAGNRLIVHVRRAGLLSSRGFLHVVGTDATGSERALADPLPLVIYPTLESKTVSVPLRGALRDVGAGTIDVIYSPDLRRRDPALASYRITP